MNNNYNCDIIITSGVVHHGAGVHYAFLWSSQQKNKDLVGKKKKEEGRDQSHEDRSDRISGTCSKRGF